MKLTIISILLSGLIVGGAIFYASSVGQPVDPLDGNNVSVIGGKQIISLNAKGGYSPRLTVAKADIPTILKVRTRGTFDCSSALVIPDINYRANLRPSGEAEIEIPPQKAGSTLSGFCAMGMYNFQIQFN